MATYARSSGGTLFINESTAMLRQYERLQKDLIAGLENLVDHVLKDEDKVRRITCGSMEPTHAKLAVDGPSIPVKLTAWKIRGTSYYAGPCLRGLFHTIMHDEDICIIFVPYADLINPADSQSKETYLSIVAGLEAMIIEIEQLE
jgi:hypothetical protein